MATLTSLTANPTSIPAGATSVITPVFALGTGTTQTARVTVTLDGGEQGSSDIQLQGAVEQPPVVRIGSTNQGWEIRTTAGTLTPGPNGTFILTN